MESGLTVTEDIPQVDVEQVHLHRQLGVNVAISAGTMAIGDNFRFF